MKTTFGFRTGRFATSLIGAVVLMAVLPAVGHAAESKLASLATAPLARGAGYEAQNGSPQVRHLQQQLRRLGQRPGPIDGLFGPLTEDAVRRFQTHAGLRVDGLVGPRTAQQLERRMTRIRHRALAREQVSTSTRINPSPVADTRAAGIRENSPNAPTETADPAGTATPAMVTGGLIVLVAAPVVALLAVMTPRRRRRSVRRVQAPTTARLEARPESDPMDLPQPDMQAPERGLHAAEPIPSGSAPAPVAMPAGTDQHPGSGAVDRRLRTAVIGYVSVPDEERFEHGDEYAEQADAIAEFCQRRGLRLVRIVRDVASPGRRAADAPGLQHACEALVRGEARALVVQNLARVTRSPARLAILLRWLADSDRGLIAIENGFDTSTSVGRLVSGALVEVGEWDRERAAQRRAANRGGGSGGGRPAVRDVPELHARIAAMRAAGFSLHAIADTLNAEGVPTLRGGSHWRPSSVQAAVGYKRPHTNNADPGLTLPELRHVDSEEEADR